MGNVNRNPTATQVDRDQLESVQGLMRFAPQSPEERGVFPGDDNTERVNYDVTIRNARPIVNELSLEREGFILTQHKTFCAHERDPVILRRKYLEELTPFIKDYFNASWVVPKLDAVFVRRAGLTVNAATEVTTTLGVRAPALGKAHIDYTRISGPMLAARESQTQGIPIRSYSRLLIINTWRAISPPPQDVPLAFCDSSSVPTKDILELNYKDDESGFTWRAGIPRYSQSHHWYYFPDLAQDELLMFMGYDSEQDYNVVHAGFDNRRVYPNAKPRESVEARFYVYYD